MLFRSDVVDWSDTTEAARAAFASLAGKIRKGGLPPLGINVLLGPDFQAMAQNQSRNLEEGRIVLAQIIAAKPMALAAARNRDDRVPQG